MSGPVGNELVAVIGVAANNGQAATTEYFTTAQIAGLGGGGGLANQVTFSSGTVFNVTQSSTGVLCTGMTIANKTVNIPTSPGDLSIIEVSDVAGNAGTDGNNITIASSSTIFGNAVIYTNGWSIALRAYTSGWVSI